MTTLQRTGATSAAVLFGLVLTLGLAHVTVPEWTRQAGLDVWNLGEAHDSLRETREQSVHLYQEQERLRESIEAAEHLTTRLITGELTLACAVDSIEPLLRGRPGFGSFGPNSYASLTFRMKVARYLIDRVQRSHEIDPSQLAALEARLESEYEEMK